MKFVIAKDIETGIYIISDNMASGFVKADYNTLVRIKDLCRYVDNRLAIYVNGQLAINAYTIIGKVYRGKDKATYYIVCDGNGKRQQVSREAFIRNKDKLRLTNVVITSDNKIKFINGSIPIFGGAEYTRNRDTVTKLGDIGATTPGLYGVNKKFFGRRVRDGALGCVKFPLFAGSYDIKNEVLAYKIGKMLGFDVAEATLESFDGRECAISIYNYNLYGAKPRSLKLEVGTDGFHKRFNEGWVKKNKSEHAWDKFVQMLMFDIITHQKDRHTSNIAFLGNDLYSLYDNGRCLFFDAEYGRLPNDRTATDDPKVDLHLRGSIVNSFPVNEHGYVWMYLEDILGYNNYKHLINHNLTRADFKKAIYECYGNDYPKRNDWIVEYVYRAYLIVTRQERMISEW
jgi:hypothetical protein